MTSHFCNPNSLLFSIQCAFGGTAHLDVGADWSGICQVERKIMKSSENGCFQSFSRLGGLIRCGLQKI